MTAHRPDRGPHRWILWTTQSRWMLYICGGRQVWTYHCFITYTSPEEAEWGGKRPVNDLILCFCCIILSYFDAPIFLCHLPKSSLSPSRLSSCPSNTLARHQTMPFLSVPLRLPHKIRSWPERPMWEEGLCRGNDAQPRSCSGYWGDIVISVQPEHTVA